MVLTNGASSCFQCSGPIELALSTLGSAPPHPFSLCTRFYSIALPFPCLKCYQYLFLRVYLFHQVGLSMRSGAMSVLVTVCSRNLQHNQHIVGVQ